MFGGVDALEAGFLGESGALVEVEGSVFVGGIKLLGFGGDEVGLGINHFEGGVDVGVGRPVGVVGEHADVGIVDAVDEFEELVGV